MHQKTKPSRAFNLASMISEHKITPTTLYLSWESNTEPTGMPFSMGCPIEDFSTIPPLPPKQEVGLNEQSGKVDKLLQMRHRTRL